MHAFVLPVHAPVLTPQSRRSCDSRHRYQPLTSAPRRRRPPHACINPTAPSTNGNNSNNEGGESDAPPTPDSVRALLSSPGKAEQQRGLLLTRHLTPTAALELLLFSLRNSTNEFIRDSAAVALGQVDLSDPGLRATATNAVVDLLATADEYPLRAAAAAAMGYMTGLPEPDTLCLVESLARALLEDADWQVHMSALASLGSLRHRRAVPVVTPWLNVQNDLLVQAALGALGDIADPAVVPDLLTQLGAQDMMTRQRLAHALSQMPHAGRYEPAIVDALRTLSRDQSFVVRDAAQSALADLGLKGPVKQQETSEDDLLDLEVSNLLDGNESGGAGVSASDAMRRRLERSFDMEFVESPHGLDGSSTPSSPPASDPASPSAATVADSPSSTSSLQCPPGAERPDSASESSKSGTELASDAAAATNNAQLAQNSDAEFAAAVADLYATDSARQALAAIKLRKFDPLRALEAVDTASALDPQKAPQRLRSACLGLLARAGAVERLIEVLKTDPEENVRSAVCDALMSVVGGGTKEKRETGETSTEASAEVDEREELGGVSENAANMATVACINALNSDEHWLVRVSAAIALGTIAKASKEAEDALLSCLQPGGVKGQGEAQASVVQRHAVTALGFMGSKSALQTFDKLLLSGELETPMRFRVAAALRSIPCVESVALARRLVHDEDDEVAEMAQGSIDSLSHQGFD